MYFCFKGKLMKLPVQEVYENIFYESVAVDFFNIRFLIKLTMNEPR